jgi:hypothetical protein
MNGLSDWPKRVVLRRSTPMTDPAAWESWTFFGGKLEKGTT